jgi:hypothetical protein
MSTDVICHFAQNFSGISQSENVENNLLECHLIQESQYNDKT